MHELKTFLARIQLGEKISAKFHPIQIQSPLYGFNFPHTLKTCELILLNIVVQFLGGNLICEVCYARLNTNQPRKDIYLIKFGTKTISLASFIFLQHANEPLNNKKKRLLALATHSAINFERCTR
jgi:hypothetical protein